MTYTEKTLGKDETITSVHQPSRWSLVGPFILGAVLMPFYGLGLLIWIGYYIAYKTTEYSITNKKVLMKRGWIRRRTDELMLGKVEGVDVIQGIQGRILGYGNLVFQGTGGQTVTFFMVPDPLKKKVELQDLLG